MKGCNCQTYGYTQEGFEGECKETVVDVVVVGSGAAAMSAAVTAKSKGSSVIVLEKGKRLGGTTARSGGGFWIPGNALQKAAGYADSRDACLRYMARYSYPNLYNPDDPELGLGDRRYGLLESFHDHATEMMDHHTEIGAIKPVLGIGWTGEAYPDYYDGIPENGGIRGRILFATDESGKRSMGLQLIKTFEEWCGANGIEFVTECEVFSILTDSHGSVRGVVGKTGDGHGCFLARQGVIFGTGGYAHDPELMRHFQPGPVYGGCSVATGTGDFIRMAGGIGAWIGNTHGAFRADSVIEAHIANPNGMNNMFFIPGDSSILVNKHGKRYVNEKKNYNDRGRAHFDWDAQRAEWGNMLTFMVFDGRTAEYWPRYLSMPEKGKPLPRQIIAADDLEGLANGISERLASMSDMTGGFSLDGDFLQNLGETIERYNGYAERGVDPEFGRGMDAYDREWAMGPPQAQGVEWPAKDSKNVAMHPLSVTGPYYAIILASGTLDTNGGPVIDGRARVLDWHGNPIDGLYGAGNCIAAPSAGAYWGGGGTIGPAMVFGYIAALDATSRGRREPGE